MVTDTDMEQQSVVTDAIFDAYRDIAVDSIERAELALKIALKEREQEEAAEPMQVARKQGGKRKEAAERKRVAREQEQKEENKRKQERKEREQVAREAAFWSRVISGSEDTRTLEHQNYELALA